MGPMRVPVGIYGGSDGGALTLGSMNLNHPQSQNMVRHSSSSKYWLVVFFQFYAFLTQINMSAFLKIVTESELLCDSVEIIFLFQCQFILELGFYLSSLSEFYYLKIPFITGIYFLSPSSKYLFFFSLDILLILDFWIASSKCLVTACYC